MAILIFLNLGPSLLLLNLNKKNSRLQETLPKNCLKLHLKIMSKLRKNLSSFFHHITFIVFEKMRSKKKNIIIIMKIKILSYSATSFSFLLQMPDAYCMVNFDRICLQLKTSKFQGNLEVIFELLESENIPRKFTRPGFV